jgi:hypothetical protein
MTGLASRYHTALALVAFSRITSHKNVTLARANAICPAYRQPIVLAG